jgi:hypothetical protein
MSNYNVYEAENLKPMLKFVQTEYLKWGSLERFTQCLIHDCVTRMAPIATYFTFAANEDDFHAVVKLFDVVEKNIAERSGQFPEYVLLKILLQWDPTSSFKYVSRFSYHLY